MLLISPLSLIMALAPSTLLAAPTRTIERLDSLADIFPRAALLTNLTSQLSHTKSLCDISHVTLPTGIFPLPTFSKSPTQPSN